jgi:multidrug efflux pump subunit AcrB
MVRRLLTHHVLANLLFGLVIVMGITAYRELPRQQDPEINFNWIQVTTFFPGASAADVERRITDPLEDAIRNISDIRFVASTSREAVSAILVRFDDLPPAVFDKRLSDLQREVQARADQELPAEVENPTVLEITSANAFPTAMVLVTGEADDENLRRQARNAEEDLERLPGVDKVLPIGLADPEIQVHFLPERLEGLGLNPTDVADSVAAWFRDVSGGTVRVAERRWFLRLLGTDPSPEPLAGLPVLGASGEVPLRDVAEVVRSREEPDELVRYRGRPAVLLAVSKKPRTNTLELVAEVQRYLEERNRLRSGTGVELVLLDDSTVPTREAIRVMEGNAVVGLGLVLLVTWVFLGSRIAVLTTLGIPFSLAGAFWVLLALGETLNTSVLLGVVIVLGMLVDDAVVIVEAIHIRLQAGVETLRAALEALREVAAPVASSVLTTMAAFLPLMLLPGILGKFMLVIPLVVTVALAVSLVEAYWMLPTHVVALRVGAAGPSALQPYRTRMYRRLQIGYVRALVRVMRRPRLALAAVTLLFAAAVAAVAGGLVRLQFFAFDPLRVFYVNVVMPPGTTLEKTLATLLEVEGRIARHLDPAEVRAVAAYAGQMFTETEPLFGEHRGQVFVSLAPREGRLRPVEAVIESLRADAVSTPGPELVSFTRLSGGPPTERAIKVKVRGDDLDEIARAAAVVKRLLAGIPGVKDVTDDASPGALELALRPDGYAIYRAGLAPQTVARTVQLLGEGEVVTAIQDAGDEVDVRVRARPRALEDIQAVLRQRVMTGDGTSVPLGELVDEESQIGRDSIRHYNYRRATTVEADIDQALTDTVTANRALGEAWVTVASDYPNIDLDFSGELDDIKESLEALPRLFLLGVGLIYLVLGTQFRSYFQPFLILTTVPMAFTGVTVGLLATGNPMSLYTLYGVVALTGIAVNSAIVLIDAANRRIASGMGVLHATLYAARRRVVPILITATTTVAGLFSLATGLGGHSLLWGPVATAIVWGLAVSTALTLFVVPVLFRFFMARGVRHAPPIEAPARL